MTVNQHPDVELSPEEKADALCQSLAAELRYEHTEMVRWTEDGPVHTGEYPTSTTSRGIAAELTAHLRAHPEFDDEYARRAQLAHWHAEDAAVGRSADEGSVR